jgi:hypothetical protein
MHSLTHTLEDVPLASGGVLRPSVDGATVILREGVCVGVAISATRFTEIITGGAAQRSGLSVEIDTSASIAEIQRRMAQSLK